MIFAHFSTKLNKLFVTFLRVWTKNKLLENFEKIFESFLQKIPKNALFLHIFPVYLANNALLFRAFGRKRQIVWKI